MATSLSTKSVQDLLHIVLRRMAASIGSHSGPSFRVASTDTAQALSTADITDIYGNLAVAATVVCETNAIRVAVGGTVPTQGATGVGVELAAGDSFYLDCPEDVLSFQFISSASGTHGALQVIPRF